MINLLALSKPWIITISVASGLAALGILMLITAVILVFCFTVYRNPRKKRVRECTNKKDEDQMRMFNAGVEWFESHKDITEHLHIVNDGLNLYGEYINFGFDKCAVILPGRTESLLYSCYFTDAYVKSGYNILVIDVRAHGLSDGKYGTAGIKESGDLIVWIKLINEKYSISDFVLHGVCVGGATAIYTYAKLKKEGSNLVTKIVTDGLFASGYDIYKQNIKKFKQPAFPVLQLTFFLTRILAGVNLFKETPMKCMKDVDIPILFIWSVQDRFSRKERSEALFSACASEHKECCFFPEGRHSHVRSAQEAEYDAVIEQFLKKHDVTEPAAEQGRRFVSV